MPPNQFSKETEPAWGQTPPPGSILSYGTIELESPNRGLG